MILFFTTDVAIETLSGELGVSKESFKNMVEKELLEELKQTSPEGSTLRFLSSKKILRFKIIKQSKYTIIYKKLIFYNSYKKFFLMALHFCLILFPLCMSKIFMGQHFYHVLNAPCFV